MQVRQDYAYFDKNSAGVLQDRLNRDADELGENLLGFPKKMIQKFVWVTANLYIVYTQSPLPFFMVAILPVIVQIVTQYFSFRYFREQHSRERKIEEESTKATSEVLRQIKTVRQFAMESKAGTEYAATGLSTHIIKQSVYLTRKSMEAAVWSFFDTGIALTLLIGFPYVASGQMTAAVLIDNFCKLNFNVNFAVCDVPLAACTSPYQSPAPVSARVGLEVHLARAYLSRVAEFAVWGAEWRCVVQELSGVLRRVSSLNQPPAVCCF